jgi:hypothetical protein
MKRSLLLAGAALVFVLPAASQAQVLSAVQSPTLNANLTETLSVSLTGGSTVNFSLTPGAAAAGDVPVSIQTGWVLQPQRGSVRLVGYFDTTDALTTPGPPATSIPSSLVFGKMTTGSPTTFTAFTQTVSGIGTAGASLLLFSETITGVNKNKTRTDNLDLQIDLTGAPQQAAGAYTGTLRIQAIAL